MATILLFMVPPPFYGLGPTWDFCGTQSYLRPWSTVNNKSFPIIRALIGVPDQWIETSE